MGCPPEPLLQMFSGPGFCFIGPEISEAFLEEVGPVDLQIHPLKAAEPESLFRRQIPRILEPDVPAVLHEILVLLAFLVDLVSPDLVNRIHQVANDMKFVKNKGCLRCTFLDHIDIRLPHIATDALEFACPLRPKIVEKAAQGSLSSFDPAPDQRL